MDCSPPGFSVHGILQTRILEWAVFSLPDLGIEPTSLASPALADRFFTLVGSTNLNILLPEGLSVQKLNHVVCNMIT